MEAILGQLKGANNTYWGNVREGFSTLKLGLKVTWGHFKVGLLKKKRGNTPAFSKNYFDQQDGVFTLEYPKEAIPVPVNGRYRLNNVVEDCIVCDKCAKVCPVNCIDIEAIKSPTEIGKASDGSSIRLYAGKFDIDMAKCCYCGLCTTVCPTECLTMTKTFDYSEFDVTNLNYEYSNLSEAEAEEKKKEYEAFQLNKRAGTVQSKEPSEEKSKAPKIPGMQPKVVVAKPAIPGAKKVSPKIPSLKKKEDVDTKPNAATGVKPKIVIPKKTISSTDKPKSASPKPVIKPKIPVKPKKDDDES